jgi:sulfatase modifying factor 1
MAGGQGGAGILLANCQEIRGGGDLLGTELQMTRSRSLIIAARIVLSAVLPAGEAFAQERITSVRKIGNDVEIKFVGVAGTSYRIERSPALAGWTDPGPSIAGTGVEQTTLLGGAGGGGRQFFRLVPVVAAIPGYVHIPSGSFLLGDQSNPLEGSPNERPVVQVPLGGFHIKVTEVTKDEWDATMTYAVANGYTFSTNAGLGKAGNHPVHSLNWFDALKWCNAKSQQDGLEPCYYVASTGLLYKTGSPSKVIWDFTKNGYRLPAEAEWEKAARGGLSGARFPGGATISHALANYKGTTSYAYDTSGINGFHPIHSVPAVLPYTAPVGSFPANGYGLRDMAGNVREYCWDSYITGNYSEGYLIRADSSSSLFQRVTRGGDWSGDAFANRCSHRGTEFPDTGKKNYVGIRLARGRLN